MREISFTVAEADLEPVLDAVLPLLPRGARVGTPVDGAVRVTSLGVAATLPGRDRLQAAAGRELEHWTEGEVPADWQSRRSGGGVLVAGRALLRAPEDDPAPEGVIDVELTWGGTGFGSGSHPTTRMSAELLLALEPGGGLLDVGCGIGTLAILAAKAGYSPVVAVDRDADAVEAARANAQRNGVEIAADVVDVTEVDVAHQPTIVANAPPEVHARIAHKLPAKVRAVVASGIMGPEVELVLDAYAAAGLAPAAQLRDPDGVWAALRLEPARG